MLKQVVILLAAIVVVTLGSAAFLYTNMNPSVNPSVTGVVTGTQQTADLSKADINGDGKVNVVDLSIIGRNMGRARSDPSWDQRADTNGDGVVTGADYTSVVNYYGKV